jgi:hypothetical protein
LGKVEQVNIILQYKISEAIHWQGACLQLAQKRVNLDCLPNPLAPPPQLRAEFFRHEPWISEKTGSRKESVIVTPATALPASKLSTTIFSASPRAALHDLAATALSCTKFCASGDKIIRAIGGEERDR